MEYTRESFITAYQTFALEWAEVFLKEAFEQAKIYPDITTFSKKIYASKKIVNKIQQELDGMVSDDIKIECELRDEAAGDVCATFKITW